MTKCFLCQTAIEAVNDAEIENVDLCVDCCENMDVVIRDYISSSPGGYDLLLDIIADEFSDPESRLRDILKETVREVLSEE